MKKEPKKLLYVKPKKLKHELSEKEVDEHRKFDCILYEICLTTASSRRFPSFSCKDCFYYYETIEKEVIDESTIIQFIKENPDSKLTKQIINKLKDKKND